MDDETSSQDSFDNGPRTNTASAKLNRVIIESLQVALQHNPEVNLLSVIPVDYLDRLRGGKFTIPPKPKSYLKRPGPANFCDNLVARAKTATVVYKLSEATTHFLAKYLEPEDPFQDPTQCLVTVLKRMIPDCEKLWEGPTRGVVLKCNDNLVAKIVRGNSDYTEYTSLQYLAEHAPDIPAPKPHGLIRFDSVRVIFMTYFPSITLEKAWSSLTHDNKVLIQQQLDEIFCKLRRLKNNGQRLGGVGGEGVKENHLAEHSSEEIITTQAQFEDFRFSVSHRASTSWITFLRSFLPPPTEDSVFTHGDVRLANIMVKANEDNNYVVSGIIDWEDSGFYPESFESTRVLYLFYMHTDTDWYAYIPACISPARHPVRWLVNRLWEHTINYS
ncbi:kinase-like domain-containing protein [Rhexocercosporidium sp. MPI-PUGE-AT-0058]|nr:kinase-like domain-containing protein [Rhexocercosporidium sp. MPI-PUGE-AT-0058]